MADQDQEDGKVIPFRQKIDAAADAGRLKMPVEHLMLSAGMGHEMGEGTRPPPLGGGVTGSKVPFTVISMINRSIDAVAVADNMCFADSARHMVLGLVSHPGCPYAPGAMLDFLREQIRFVEMEPDRIEVSAESASTLRWVDLWRKLAAPDEVHRVCDLARRGLDEFTRKVEGEDRS